eukprot:gene12968-biopygen6655
MCPEHQQPVVALCEADGALLCTSCHTKPEAPHHGHTATSVDYSATLLGQQLAALLDGVMARGRDMATAAVEWKGQAAVAEFLSATQCALVEAEGEKIKMLVDSATALACQQMRASATSLKEEQLCALGHISLASAEAAVFAGEANRALHAGCPGNLVACLSAAQLKKTPVLEPGQPATTRRIFLQEHSAVPSSLFVQHSVFIRVGRKPYTIISAGSKHCCALSQARSILCWGVDHEQQCSGAPAGPGFLSVTAGRGVSSSGVVEGGKFSVALKSDGSLHSWGTGTGTGCSGTPPGTGFVAVSAAGWVGIAIRVNRTLAAWGDDRYKQISGLPGGNDFVEVSVGSDFAGVPLQLLAPAAVCPCHRHPHTISC